MPPFQHICTNELVVQTIMMIAVSVVLRFVLFGCSGVAAHKGAYGALFKVRCMVAEHLAKVPLGTLNERRTGDIKTVLNEDIEKLELFLAHNLPDLVCYMVGPVAIFYLFNDSKYPIGTGFPVAVDSGRCGNGGYVSEYGRFDEPGEPIYYNAQFRYDRVYQRYETD